MSSRPSRGAARLAAILDALPDALLLVNANGTVVNANSIALETFEAPGTALVGRGLLDLLPGFDSKRIPGSMRRPDPAEGPRTRPTRMIARRTDGTEFPVEVTSANLEDAHTPYADGYAPYTGDELLMLVVRDLTGTLDTENELARQQRQTEMILRAASEGVVGVDTEGKVVLVNPAAAQILGFRASDLGGQELHPLVHHSRPDGSPLPYEETPLADTLRSGRKHRVRGQVLWTKDGRLVPVDLTTAPVREGELLVGAVMTFTDRSRLNSLAQRHAQLRAVLDASLRAPLEELRGELTGLADDPAGHLWPEANRILQHLAAGSTRMTSLIDNVLSFQRLDAGAERLDRKKVGLDEVITAGVDGAVDLIGPGRAQYAVHAPPIKAVVDGKRLAQAISHLIVDVAGVDTTGNTTIAAGDSTIVVAAARRGDVVRIDVRGPHGGGSPVHLPITRGIIERHGGVLQTHDVPGGQGGSAYVLEVPIGDVGDADEADGDPVPAADGREHDSGMTVMPRPSDPVRGTRAGAPGTHGAGPAPVRALRPGQPGQPGGGDVPGPRPRAAIALPPGTGGGAGGPEQQPTGRRRALRPAEAPDDGARPPVPQGPPPGAQGPVLPQRAALPPRAELGPGAPGPGLPGLPGGPGAAPAPNLPGIPGQALAPQAPQGPPQMGQPVPPSGRRARRTLAEVQQQPEPPQRRAIHALPPGRSDAAAPAAAVPLPGPMNGPANGLAGGPANSPMNGPVNGPMNGAAPEAAHPQGRRARREDWLEPQAAAQAGLRELPPAPPNGQAVPDGRNDQVPQQPDVPEPTGRRAKHGGTAGPAHPGAMPPGSMPPGAMPPGAMPPAVENTANTAHPAHAGRPAHAAQHEAHDADGRAISVRTLGQGMPLPPQPAPGGLIPQQAQPQQTQSPQTQPPQARPPQPQLPSAQPPAAQQQPKQPLPEQGQQSGPANGSGRRRRLAAPQEPGVRPHPADPAAADGAQPDTRNRPANPAFHPSDTQGHGHAFSIGAPADGTEGPELLDGPGGAVEVMPPANVPAIARPVPNAGVVAVRRPEGEADDDVEELSDPRRLLVWPEPDVSTRQALTDRGYRPVTVRSREEVDAQVAEYPAALFVDPLTGPITRTALQALRAAAVAAEVPVLVTAGLGQATREAAYGADPAVLLKALAPRDSEQHPPRVLLVESHQDIATAFTATLERRGMQVAHAASEGDAANLAAQMRPNLVVMDLMLIRRRRVGIVDWLRANGLLNRTPLVVYTSVDIDPAELPRLSSGETVLFLAERSTSGEVQGRIVDLLSKIGTEL